MKYETKYIQNTEYIACRQIYQKICTFSRTFVYLGVGRNAIRKP